MQLPLLSIVSPAFNEQEVLPAFHAVVAALFDSLGDRYRGELLIVDDGSRDETPAVLRDLCARDRRVRYVRLSRNFGQQAALTAGFQHARGDIVVSMDCDLQHPPAVILPMLDAYERGADVVLGVRRDQPGISRRKSLTSGLFHWLMRWCSGMDLRPNLSEFRLLSRTVVDALLQMPERLRYLRGMVHWLGFPAVEIEFDVPPRAAGHTKFTLVRMVRLARDGLLSFSRVPLHAALLVSGGLIAASFITCLTAWVFWHPELSAGWLTLAVIFATHLGATGIWLALVAFSEYLARIHEQVLGRPLFVVREDSDRQPRILEHPARLPAGRGDYAKAS